jgi:hypothetical protein
MTARWCMIFSTSRRDHWGGELCGGTYDVIGAVADNLVAGDGSDNRGGRSGAGQ